MNDMAFVRELEGFANGGTMARACAGEKRAAPIAWRKLTPSTNSIREIVVTLRFSKVVDGDDVGVIESGEGLCFFLEVTCELGVVGSFGGKKLERDVTVQ